MLVSPGQQISISDQSQYVSGAVGSVPLVIFATAQDKVNPSGAIAGGTTKANAGRLQMFTSQRDLVSSLGYPTFKQSSAGTPLHGDERNEYGLMAAYSTLGLANKIYAIRADVDLAQLNSTAVRPAGSVPSGTNWLDLASTNWGVNVWDATTSTFTKVTPMIVVLASEMTSIDGINYPLSSIGAIGSYAISLSASRNGNYNGSEWALFYRSPVVGWALVGSDEWSTTHPTVKCTVSSPVIAPASTIVINGVTVAFTNTTLAQSVIDINNAAIPGVSAASYNNRLELYATAASKSNGSVADGFITVGVSSTALSVLGMSTGTFAKPVATFGTYVQIPSWRSSDSVPRPSGSIYVKTTATGGGASVAIKKYSQLTDSWTALAAPLFQDAVAATAGLDKSGGGFGIASNSVFVKYDVETNGTITFKPYAKYAAGATKIVANLVGASPFIPGDSFVLSTTSVNSLAVTSYTITLGASNRASFVAAVLEANMPEVVAAVEANGAISLTHKYGGVMTLTNTVGVPIQSAGFNTTLTGVQGTINGSFEFSGWSPLQYTYSVITPTQNPVDGTLWYYGSAVEVDIMINTLTGWKGYQNETNDARGYNLSNTDPTGCIVSASKPTSQTDSTALVPGDMWLNTGDLENWPALSRYTGTAWVTIDDTDQVSQNGIIFADARWGTTGAINVINGAMPAIAGTDGLSTSDHLDTDAPDSRLFPRGTLLLNTRRSGYNVKRFVSNYFNEHSFPNTVLPAVTDTWVSASGLKDNGSMYAGHQAQRHMIVSAMRGALDGSTEVREEQFQFNLLVAPGYPELIANMVALNNDRVNTAFVIGDTPMRLAPNGIDLANWSNNSDNATGLSTNDPYLGIYYPGCAATNDVQGNSIVQPASHIALRTFIHSDNMSYMWFAPAGTRRGMVDNATSVGYIDSMTGEYNPIGVSQGLRDTLYENKINPITNLPGVGLVVWGQKTRNPTASSMDRVNVARLVNYIRTILATVGNGFLFEPNDKITRDQIKTIISGAINDLVAKRGIYDYLVVCDDSNNTPTRITRNELYVDIAISPMKDVEFIYIPVRLYNPGDISKL